MAAMTTPPSYKEPLHTFIAVLNHAQHQGELPAACSTFDSTVVQAIGEVAHAAHDGNPNPELISQACKTFAKSAAQQEAAKR